MAAEWFPSGWAHYLTGGVVIGVGVSLAFVTAGLITGMSTVFSSTWSWVSRLDYFQRERMVASRGWRAVLALGLVSPLIYLYLDHIILRGASYGVAILRQKNWGAALIEGASCISLAIVLALFQYAPGDSGALCS